MPPGERAAGLWRRLGAVLILALGLCAGPLRASSDGTVTDLAGRAMPVPARSERILLGEGRMIPVLAILLGEELDRRIVGMPSDFELLDPAGYAQYTARFPRLREVVRTGRTTAESFSVEKAVSLAPDVAIFGLEGHGPTPEHAETLARLSTAGVTVVFVDFRKEPLLNTPRSMKLLGRILRREEAAAAFVGEYEVQLARVTDRLAAHDPPKPTVFIENRVGLGEECCPTMSEGLLGTLLDAAGGRNIAKGLVPGAFGVLNLEHLVSRKPEVYIGTAIGAPDTVERMPMRIVLGAGVDAATARDSLARAVQRPGISTLPAIPGGRAHGIWHHFYMSPFNVVAVQVFAKWLHPELFQDLDPEETLAMFYERFQPVPLDGRYWTTLETAPAARR